MTPRGFGDDAAGLRSAGGSSGRRTSRRVEAAAVAPAERVDVGPRGFAAWVEAAAAALAARVDAGPRREIGRGEMGRRGWMWEAAAGCLC